MKTPTDPGIVRQYSLPAILLIWAAAAVPMALLGWVIAPIVASNDGRPGFSRLAVLTVGLIWQFVLVLLLLYRETGTLEWSVIGRSLWLNTPRNPVAGERNRRLWWWLIPLILVTAGYEIGVSGLIDQLWLTVFPFLSEPSGYSLGAALGTAAARAQLIGAWDVLALFGISALFNTFLGEELLFRGFLLPRMAQACGRWDWVVNGGLFALYHLHQPWGILSAAVDGMLMYALPSRYWRSSWFGIIAHSGQSLYFAFLILGLVLGLA